MSGELSVRGVSFGADPLVRPGGDWHSVLMRLTDRLSQPQRIVVVVAFGIACALVGNYVNSVGGLSTGWYAYAPLTSAGPQPHLQGWERLLIWLALTLVWALVSTWLLRPHRTPGQS